MNVSSDKRPEPPGPSVSVVIPNYNGSTWLSPCLDALAGQEFRDFEVVLVDNGSTDGSVALLRERYSRVRLIVLERNTGFAAAVNVGIRAAQGEYVALLNNDTVAKPLWLGALVQTMNSSPEDVVAVASKMLLMDDPARVDDAGDVLSWTGAAQKVGHGQPATDFVERREIFSPCAGATLYRRSFLEQLLGFDERFFAYLEDVDLGLRGRLLGYRYVFEPAAEVLHKGHGSAIPRSDYVRLITRNRLMLFAKSVPLHLWLKHLPQLLYGQIYFLFAYRKPLQSFAGYASLLPCIPHILRERRRIARSRRLSVADIERLLTTEMNEPPLRELLRHRLRRLRP
jgi:GT2 family glycosyltransferase